MCIAEIGTQASISGRPRLRIVRGVAHCCGLRVCYSIVLLSLALLSSACKLRLGINESQSSFTLFGTNTLVPASGGSPLSAALTPSPGNYSTAFSGALFAVTPETAACPGASMQAWALGLGGWFWSTNASATVYSPLRILPTHLSATTAGQPYMLQNWEVGLEAVTVAADASGVVAMSGTARLLHG